MRIENKIKGLIRFTLALIMILGTTNIRAQYHVNLIGEHGDEITLRVVGYGKNGKKATEDAELNVIKALIFNGIANSRRTVPMINNPEKEVTSLHQEYFSNLYAISYKNFISASKTIIPFGKNDIKQKCITIDVTVNVRALRNNLEQNGIIRKFGL